MKNKEATANNLLKKLYAFTHNKSLAFKRIMPVHKHIFWAIEDGGLDIAEKTVSIEKELSEYKIQNRLWMDEETMLDCVSVYDIFLGKEGEKEKLTIEQKRILKRQEAKKIQKEKSQKQLHQKQLEYNEKIKEFQKQKQILEEKKKTQQLKRLQQVQEEERKIKIEKQKELEKQREQKKKKIEAGLKQMEQKRQKRQEMIKQLAIKNRRSQSMKTLGHSVPKYIELEKEYLERQRRKVQEMKQMQKQKRQSMQLKIEEIKNHEKQYIQKLKEKFSSKVINKEKSDTDTKPSKAKSEFNAIKFRDQEQEHKFREKAQRRKQFQSKIRNIPIHIDINKKKEKQIEIDKQINKQKYILLANRHLDDDQIFNEFKDFQLKIDPRNLGKNYLNQLRNVSKAPKSQRLGKKNSEQFLQSQPSKYTYINYLEQLKTKSKSTRKSEPQILENDELLRLVQNSKKILKKHHQSQQNILEKSRVSLKDSSSNKVNDVSAKVKENELKKEVSKSITQKIVQYERKVLKKVNDLKKMSQYDESLKNQTEIDDIFSKVLKAKIDTIGLT